MPRRGFSAWPLCAIAVFASIAAIAAYARVVGFGFVYDDLWSIQRNAHLGEPLGSLLAASIGGHGFAAGIPDATRPTMIASIWIDHRLSGLHAGFYHVHSLVLHALDAALAVLAGFALTRRRVIAVAAGVWMAVVPLQAEAVASINYREDLLVAAGLLATLAWVFWPNPERSRRGAGFGIALVWVLALFAKESAVALALIIPAVALTPRGRRGVVAREQELVLLLAILAVWLNWRLGIRAVGDDVPLAPHASVMTRLLDTARFEIESLYTVLVPVTSRPEYPRLAHASTWWAVGLVPIVAALVLLFRRRRLHPAALGATIALLAPLAASPLVGPINARADRYLYLAVFGAGLVWGTMLDRAVPVRWAPLALGTVAVVLAGLSWRAAAPWSNDLALWTRAVETAPRSPRAWAALARLARLRGDLETSHRLVEKAIELDPDYLPAHVTRLYDAVARGDPHAAASELRTIDRLGGSRLPAVARARQCAALRLEEAQRCIGGAR